MKLEEVIQIDTRANQPAATAVPVGTLFCVTDEGDIVERSNGTTWDSYSPASASGTVTHTGTLTANRVILGNGTADVTALGSLGTTTTVLHGNAAGAPTFGAVSLTADVSGDLPFANLTPATAASKLLGRGDSGAGDFQEITIGTNLSMSGTTLSATAGGTGDVVGPASSVASELVLFDGTSGKLVKRATGSGWVKATSGVYSATTIPRTVGITIDGGGSAITTGVKGYIQCPFAGTISAVTVLADVSGSIVIDIWKDTYANYPPTVADTITASAKPTISAATKATDSTLTGWTTSVSAGDCFGFNVDSASTVTRATLTLTVAES